MLKGNPLTFGLLLFALFSFGRVSVTQVILLLLGLVVLFVYFLWRNQEAMLYQPHIYKQHVRPADNPPGFRSPADMELPYQNVTLTTDDDVKIHGWFVHQGDAKLSKERPTVLFFHANAGNMGFRLPNIKHLHSLLHCNVFVLSYRGYGDSAGTPNQTGIMLDAEAALAWCMQSEYVDPKQLILFGRSLGGSVAIHMAGRFSKQIAATIVENTFTSISDLVDSMFPLLRVFKQFILRMKWDAISQIPKIKHPILFLSGLQDEVVPRVHMARLHEAATGTEHAVLKEFADGRHNDTWDKGGARYWSVIRTFVSRHVSENLPDLPKDVEDWTLAKMQQKLMNGAFQRQLRRQAARVAKEMNEDSDSESKSGDSESKNGEGKGSGGDSQEEETVGGEMKEGASSDHKESTE